MLAAVGSGVGAVVIIGGALWSAWRFARARTTPGNGRRAAANVLIALGTLVLSSGGLIQGIAGKDEAFVITLASGIAVIYAGFLVASGAGATESPANVGTPAPVSPGAGDAQLAAEELARFVARERVDDLDRRGHLVPREMARGVVAHLLDRQARARLEHDPRGHRFAGARVRHPDHRGIRDVGCASSTSSTSAGKTLKPETITRSFLRSTRLR